MSPRIISGRARGCRLFSLPGDRIRPITDRAKEALFNILGDWVLGSTWLDLFAGTGSVGLEALSRGAAFVRFVDWSPQAIRLIRRNLAHCRLDDPGRYDVLHMDAFALLRHPPDRTFDIIFIAPPQYHGLWKKALLALDENPAWLAADGEIIVQIHPREYEPLSLKTFEETEQRRYGGVLLVFYARREDETEEAEEDTSSNAAASAQG